MLVLCGSFSLFHAAMMAAVVCVSVRILASLYLVLMVFSNFVHAKNGRLCFVIQLLLKLGIR